MELLFWPFMIASSIFSFIALGSKKPKLDFQIEDPFLYTCNVSLC